MECIQCLVSWAVDRKPTVNQWLSQMRSLRCIARRYWLLWGIRNPRPNIRISPARATPELWIPSVCAGTHPALVGLKDPAGDDSAQWGEWEDGSLSKDFSRLQCANESGGKPLKCRSGSVGLGWGLTFFISKSCLSWRWCCWSTDHTSRSRGQSKATFTHLMLLCLCTAVRGGLPPF